MERYTVSGSGADCKSAVLDSGGSTPSLSTSGFLILAHIHMLPAGPSDKFILLAPPYMVQLR